MRVGIGIGIPTFGGRIFRNTPPGFTTKPDVYLNFVGGYGTSGGVSSPIASLLTCARASTRYVDDTSGNWTLVGNNVPGISNKGLLVEEARTNSIRNNSMQGAVIGTPGTLPNFWSVGSQPTGVTRTIVGVGTVNGIDYIDVNFSGTNTGSLTQIIFFIEPLNSIAAASGQTWASSVFTAVLQSDAGVTGWNVSVTGTNGASQTENANSSAYLGSTLSRMSVLFLLANAGTTFVQPRLATNGIPNGVTINWTVRIGWPQLEQGAFATSPIRTTAAAVPRAVDSVNLISVPVFGSQYSLYAAGVPNAPNGSVNQIFLQADAGSDAQRSALYRNGTPTSALILAGGSGVNYTTGTWSQGVSSKLAAAIAANDQAVSMNGNPVVTPGVPAAVLPTTPTVVHFGTQTTVASAVWNGYISEAAIWASQRLPNAQLQAGTT